MTNFEGFILENSSFYLANVYVFGDSHKNFILASNYSSIELNVNFIILTLF